MKKLSEDLVMKEKRKELLTGKQNRETDVIAGNKEKDVTAGSTDNCLQACSVMDCTGLVVSPPRSDAELDSYEELYPFLPKAVRTADKPDDRI